jgi:hypothetical protein
MPICLLTFFSKKEGVEDIARLVAIGFERKQGSEVGSSRRRSLGDEVEG